MPRPAPGGSDGLHRTPLEEVLHRARRQASGGWAVVTGEGAILADRVEAAATPWRRIRGLIARSEPGGGEALLLHPCAQVHTFGMRFPIDAVFCDEALRVLAVATLPPHRLSRLVRGARCCFELRAGTASALGVVPDSQLALRRRAAS